MDDRYVEIPVENIFGNKRIIKGYITEVEDDCIHITTIDGKQECINRCL